jgi:hypothetical protein
VGVVEVGPYGNLARCRRCDDAAVRDLMRCADEARLHREPWDTLALSISSQTPYQMQTAPPRPRGGWRCAIVS